MNFARRYKVETTDKLNRIGKTGHANEQRHWLDISDKKKASVRGIPSEIWDCGEKCKRE